MMNAHMQIALLATAAVFFVLIAVAIRHLRRLQASHKSTWEELMQRIVPVDRRSVEIVALDAVDPSGERRADEHRRELGRQEIWNLLGGMDGINRIQNNSRVFIEIAAYLERWHPEAADTAEEMRLEARRLEWHVSRLKAAENNKSLELHFHSYGQNAAISYYLMVNKLLALYEYGRAALLGDLQRALS
jgi:hypothetical protein